GGMTMPRAERLMVFSNSALRKACACIAIACAPAAMANDLFTRLDADGDGYLGAEELGAGVQDGGWVAMDRDGDGRIARDELALRGDEPPAGVRARELLGRRVHDPVGDGLGRVDDLIVHE